MAQRPIRTPDLAELRTFARTVRSGSMAAAAAELRVSKAAVSKRITALEALFGSPLLERTSRGVRPTPLGRELCPRIEALLADVDDLFGGSVAPETGTRGRISGVRTLIGTPGPSAEQIQIETEDLLGAIFHAGVRPMAICHLESGVIVDANDAFCRLVGAERSSVLGRSGVEIGLTANMTREAFASQLRVEGDVRFHLHAPVTGPGAIPLEVDAVLHVIRGVAYSIITIDDPSTRALPGVPAVEARPPAPRVA